MRKTRSLALPLLLCALSAQTQSRGAPPSKLPPFVQLNVIALDARGVSVNDLKSEELQVADGGKPQQILYFRRNDTERGAAAKLGPEEFSNRNGGPNPRATVILLDLLNENMVNRVYGADEIDRALQKAERTDYVYIYLLAKDGTLFAVRPVPPANELLLPVKPSDKTWTDQLHGMLDTALRTQMQRRTADLRLTTGFIGTTYQALLNVAREIAPFPGRKNLIWISRGVPVAMRLLNSRDVDDFTIRLRALAAQLDRENVAVTTVAVGADSAGTNLEERRTLETITALTGGPPTVLNDLSSAVNQALQAGTVSYRIVYDPSSKNWDNKFHKIKVTCARAGVRLQVKESYTADPKTIRGDEQAETIAPAMAGAFDIREIGLRLAIVGDAAGPRRLQIRLNLPDVLLLRSSSGDHYQCELVVSTTRYFRDGPPKFATLPVPLELTEKQRESMLVDGLTFGDNDPLAANIEKVRVVVYDRGSGSVGALTVPVHQ
jgi:VWFA-related protein